MSFGAGVFTSVVRKQPVCESLVGTPSDESVRQAVAALKARGLAVTLYPFVLMDVPAGNGLPDPYGGPDQAAYPWRGRVTGPDGESAAAAVAAHECGHAVQHQQAYAWLGFRSKMVPIVNIASQMMNVVMMLGLVGMFALGNGALIWVIVGCLAVTTAFSLVTLPVEFDASRRAMVWLEQSGLADAMEHERAKNALFWAAMTYVAGAVGSVSMLLYYVMQLMGARRNE
jgi:hypothetical protein